MKETPFSNFDHEFNLASVTARMGWMELGRIISPFFLGEHWDKLMEARKDCVVFDAPNACYDTRLNARYKVSSTFHEWFEQVYQALQEACQAKEKERERMHQELEGMLKKLDDPQNREAWKTWADSFNDVVIGRGDSNENND